jgi:hypothetical protein
LLRASNPGLNDLNPLWGSGRHAQIEVADRTQSYPIVPNRTNAENEDLSVKKRVARNLLFLRRAFELLRAGKVVAGFGVVRLEAEGLLELGDGLVKLAVPAKGDAEFVVSHGIIGFDANGFLELDDGAKSGESSTTA